jgi:hypothetical protein
MKMGIREFRGVRKWVNKSCYKDSYLLIYGWPALPISFGSIADHLLFIFRSLIDSENPAFQFCLIHFIFR